ncbi:PiggyBac transposable element-derived protein 4 [Plakobranchus ocellatus]|uniref:PiggyBac transposable element-derived protein 4 n=1 Tax=Plakobranchus ocellatus TaxID=259542 RepID=A0AAV4A819_9GAST|nr:PiggyBac transposable element-derived protein 4 [Plakobranchus ocellatus]
MICLHQTGKVSRQRIDLNPKNRNEPGVRAELAGDSSVLSCFRCLFDDEVTDLLLEAINICSSTSAEANPTNSTFKSFGLTDSSTGYVLNLPTYYGRDTSYDPETDQNSGHDIKIFDTLLKPIGEGYHVFADSYYTTRALIDHLISKDMNYTGTVQVNRVGFPPEIKTMRLGHMESKHWMAKTDSIFCLAWKIKKPKNQLYLPLQKLVLTLKNKGSKSVPSSIDCYNQNMNGCNLEEGPSNG